VQRLEQERPRHVVSPDVVLDVERSVGRVREERARRERIAAVGEDGDAGLGRVLVDQSSGRLGEAALGGFSDRQGRTSD
jgi:hypothetical protein